MDKSHDHYYIWYVIIFCDAIQCGACKWFGTYTPRKSKSHNEIYLHSMQVYNSYSYAGSKKNHQFQFL
jgi:hypothetical protein